MAINQRLISYDSGDGGAAAASIKPSEHFDTVLYTGNGSTQSISGGWIGEGAEFNGSSSKITVPLSKSDISGTNGAVSVSWWMNAASDHLGFIFEGNADQAYMIHTNTSGVIRVGLASSDLRFDASSAYTVGEWTHFVATFTDTEIKLYKNGNSTAIGSDTHTSSVTIPDFSTAAIGWRDYGASENNFNGKLDQIRIFNKVLSSSEITTLYGEDSMPVDVDIVSGCVALYEFEGNYKDTANNGKYGKAAHFNGSSSYITVNDKLTPSSGAFSISWWMSWNGDSDYAYVFDNGGGSTGNGLYCIAHDSVDTLYFGFKNGSTLFQSNSGAPSIEKNTWIHWCLTWDGTTGTDKFKVYKNGVATSYTSTVANTTPAYNFRIGEQNGTGGEHINARIDDFRVYHDELTSTEVGYLYNNTTASIPDDYVAYYKFDGNALDETNNYDGTASNVTYGYDGTASNVSLTKVLNFSPDFVWFKSRNAARSNAVVDSVRGNRNIIWTDLPSQAYDSDVGDDVTSFDDNGFSIGAVDNAGSINTNNDNIVAWCLKAGGTAVSNTDGSITSQVSANPDAGFSIVSWTSTASTSTIGHGLNSTPELIIMKSTTNTGDWQVYSSAIGNTKKLLLNSTSQATTSGVWGNTSPTTSVFTSAFNSVGSVIAYCFHSVDGFSKVGSYTGTGAAGNMVETGFAPAFVMVKNTTSGSADDWHIFDNKRDTQNPNSYRLKANTNDIESTSDEGFNFTSDGFEVLGSSGARNENNNTYIYLAIAADADTTTPTVEKSFDIATYSGTSAEQSIDSFPFKPDLVWIKGRTLSGSNPVIYDSIRGATKYILPNTTGAEGTISTGLTSFDTNGFTIGSEGGHNNDGDDFVAWAWKAGDHDNNLPEINTEGSIDSTVSVNDAAGFSIVKYTGDGTAGTVGHGFSSAPEIIIFKNITDGTVGWEIYHTAISPSQSISFTNGQAYSGSARYNGAASADTFGVATSNKWTNYDGDDYIAYCFKSVTGYQKVGSYSMSTNVQVSVDVGFAPRFVLFKETTRSAGWVMVDNQRTLSGDYVSRLYPDSSSVESTGEQVQITGNTFKINWGSTGNNDNGGTGIYLAIA